MRQINELILLHVPVYLLSYGCKFIFQPEQLFEAEFNYYLTSPDVDRLCGHAPAKEIMFCVMQNLLNDFYWETRAEKEPDLDEGADPGSYYFYHFVKYCEIILDIITDLFPSPSVHLCAFCQFCQFPSLICEKYNKSKEELVRNKRAHEPSVCFGGKSWFSVENSWNVFLNEISSLWSRLKIICRVWSVIQITTKKNIRERKIKKSNFRNAGCFISHNSSSDVDEAPTGTWNIIQCFFTGIDVLSALVLILSRTSGLEIWSWMNHRVWDETEERAGNKKMTLD